MNKIKIAQIGTSETTHSAHIMNAMLEMSDIFEVVGVADVDVHKCPLNPIFSNVPQMSVEELLDIPGLEAVVIDCDENLLTKYAIMVAEKGLPIQFEKPGSESDAEFDKLIDIVEKKQLVFHTSYMYRYNPAVMYAKEKIQNGDIGDVYCIEAQMNIYHDTGMRNRYKDYEGGIMFYLGCHMVDIIYQILGEPLSITPYNTNIGVKDVEAKDFGMAVFQYKNGASIAKVSAAEVGGAPYRRYIIICGTKGTLELRPIELPVGNGFDVATIRETYIEDDAVKTTTFAPHKRYTRMLSDFAKMVRGEMKNPYSYEYERNLHKLILKACGKL